MTIIPRPASVSYRRSPSWSAALSDSPGTPASGSERATSSQSPSQLRAHSTATLTNRSHPLQTRSWPNQNVGGSDPSQKDSPLFFGRRWSADDETKPRTNGGARRIICRTHDWGTLCVDQPRHIPETPSTAETLTPLHRNSSLFQRTGRSRSVDTVQPHSPSGGRRLKGPPGSLSPSRSSSLSALAQTERNLLRPIRLSSIVGVSSMPTSPTLPQRPDQIATAFESGIRSPLRQSYAWDTFNRGQRTELALEEEPHSPTTVRPSSIALDTIIEGTSMDQYTSFGDVGAFAFDHYRWSSNSTRSDARDIDSRSSPVPATHSEVPTGRSSRTSSRYTDVSSQRTSASFRPKLLLLTGASLPPSPAARSRHLSRSVSMPWLTLDPAPAAGSSQTLPLDRQESETVPLPASPSVSQGSVQNTAGGPKASPSPDSPQDQRSEVNDDGGANPKVDPCSDVPDSESSRSPPLAIIHLRNRTKPALAPISTSSSSSFNPPATGQDAGPQDHRLSTQVSKSDSRSLLSPTQCVTFATQTRDSDCSTTDTKQRPSPKMASTPQSAASADTQSSETIEYVPWHVATTDSDSRRRSEEIFRPLSMSLSMIRSGPGSSRDTALSRALSYATAVDTLSRHSASHMPQIPLQDRTGFVRGSTNVDSEGASDSNPSRAGAWNARSERTGLGISGHHVSTACQTRTTEDTNGGFIGAAEPKKSDAAGTPDQSDARKARKMLGNRISSPPGGMQRLLRELEEGPLGDQSSQAHSRHVGLKDDGLEQSHTGSVRFGLQHQRRSTLQYPFIQPRVSSIRRRPQSVDVNGRYRRALYNDPDTIIGLEAVAEHPLGSASGFNAAAPSVRFIDAIDAAVQPSCSAQDARLDLANNLSSSKVARVARGLVRRLANSRPLRLALSLHVVVYEALFFIFEAPFLGLSISPAVPLVAALLSLTLDLLLVCKHAWHFTHTKHLIGLLAVGLPTMALCTAMCALKIVVLTKSHDRGANSPGIHFHRARDGGGSAFAQVLRDMPMSAVLFTIGIFAMLFGIIVATALLFDMDARRKTRRKPGGVEV